MIKSASELLECSFVSLEAAQHAVAKLFGGVEVGFTRCQTVNGAHIKFVLTARDNVTKGVLSAVRTRDIDGKGSFQASLFPAAAGFFQGAGYFQSRWVSQFRLTPNVQL